MLLAREPAAPGYWTVARLRGEPLMPRPRRASSTLPSSLAATASASCVRQKAAVESREAEALPTFGEIRVGNGYLTYRDK